MTEWRSIRTHSEQREYLDMVKTRRLSFIVINDIWIFEIEAGR